VLVIRAQTTNHGRFHLGVLSLLGGPSFQLLACTFQLTSYDCALGFQFACVFEGCGLIARKRKENTTKENKKRRRKIK
jgi:hypothetical protein